MRASSQAALDQARERWEPVLRQVGGRGVALGEQLFAVVDLLDGSASLRRALTEPTRSGQDKAGLVQHLLGGRVDAEVADLLGGLARERWSTDADLADAVESLAVTTVLAAAESAGRLAVVEDESYRLARILTDERELRLAVSDKHADPARRAELVETVLAGKVAPETATLAARAARAPRGQPVPSLLRRVAELAAARREHLVASVTSAVPLTREQIDRLAAILRRRYDRAVQVHVGIDPAVVGGLRVQVGDDVIDATLASRLAEVRRRVAG
ncbi:F0F1 ATP synthase subunit delta [Georgenia sp. M64]|uniref:F0F1 ATP synthase subunit delta n=1 Tax=Georgenia sp. M64 TaxID=3120520 RepID=UPI0030DF8D9D